MVDDLDLDNILDMEEGTFSFQAACDRYFAEVESDLAVFQEWMPATEASLASVFGLENMLLMNTLLGFHDPETFGDAVIVAEEGGVTRKFMQGLILLQALGIVIPDSETGVIVAGPLFDGAVENLREHFRVLGNVVNNLENLQ